jgi:DNA-binding MarR family transcriptional regulator
VQASSPPRRLASATASATVLARQLTAFFRYASVASDPDFLSQVADHDLTLNELKLLLLVYERRAAPDTEELCDLSVKELAEQLGISLPAASRAVDPLVRRRLVVRREDASDRRVRRVRTTAAGDRLVERLAATRVASFERLLAELSSTERRKLGDALDELMARPEISRHTPGGGCR